MSFERWTAVAYLKYTYQHFKSVYLQRIEGDWRRFKAHEIWQNVGMTKGLENASSFASIDSKGHSGFSRVGGVQAFWRRGRFPWSRCEPYYGPVKGMGVISRSPSCPVIILQSPTYDRSVSIVTEEWAWTVHMIRFCAYTYLVGARGLIQERICVYASHMIRCTEANDVPLLTKCTDVDGYRTSHFDG